MNMVDIIEQIKTMKWNYNSKAGHIAKKKQ